MSTGDFGGEWRRGTRKWSRNRHLEICGRLECKSSGALTRLLLLWHVRPTPGMFLYTKQGTRSSSLYTYV